jgi:hypothetical protein
MEVSKTFFCGRIEMRTRAVLLSITIVVLLWGVCPAEDFTKSVNPILDKSVEAAQPAVPYAAEITGVNINIRSGPGMNFYRCGKLNKPDRVTVVEHKSGWSKIVPPPGSFSWISKQYIKVDSNNPAIGIVTGDEVRVWAGSKHVEPIHSASLQTKLNIGRTVTLMGEERSGYYKIVPPKGAHLWVSTQYTKYLNPLDNEIEIKTGEPRLAPSIPKPKSSVVSPPKPRLNDEILRKYRDLERRIDEERVKPISEQDYNSIKEALAGIVKNRDSGRAGRYATLQLERINRFEIARHASEKIQEQDKKLAQLRKQIREDGRARLAQIRDLGRFTVIGKLRPSQIYHLQTGPTRYLIVDAEDSAICYAQPVSEEKAPDMSLLVGSKVGVIGQLVTETKSSLPLVIFDQIEQINQEDQAKTK